MACKCAQYMPEKQKDVQKREAKRRITHTLLVEQDYYEYTRTKELNTRTKSQKHSQYTPEQEMTA